MRKLNPIRFFKLFRDYVKELNTYLFYRKKVNSLIDAKEFEKRGLRVDNLKRIYFIQNLAAETLLYGESEPGGLAQFEKQFVAENLRLHNEFFITNQLIDIVKTSLERIKTKDFYAYLVKIHFRFDKLTVGNTIFILLYLSGFTYLTTKLIVEFPNIQHWVVAHVNQWFF